MDNDLSDVGLHEKVFGLIKSVVETVMVYLIKSSSHSHPQVASSVDNASLLF